MLPTIIIPESTPESVPPHILVTNAENPSYTGYDEYEYRVGAEACIGFRSRHH